MYVIIILADLISVPLHISSPIINVLELLRFNIAINSVSSTINDDWPLNKLSVPTIRVNKEL